MAANVLVMGGTAGLLSAALTLATREARAVKPYQDAHRLARIWETAIDDPADKQPVSPGSLDAWRRAAVQHFIGFEGFIRASSPGTLSVNGVSQAASVGWCTAGLFPLLGAHAACGRYLRGDDSARSIVMRYETAAGSYGDPCRAVGAVVEVEGRPYEVVGVLPRTVDLVSGVDLWMPLQLGELTQSRGRSLRSIDVIAKLRSGSDLDDARLELKRISGADVGERAAKWNVSIVPLAVATSAVNGPALRLLTVAMTLLTILGGTTVALFQSSSLALRRDECFVKCVVGARPVDLRGELAGETLLVGGLGACVAMPLGVSLALFGGRWLNSSQAIASVPNIAGEAAVMAAGVSVFVGLVAAAPGLYLVGGDMLAASTLRSQRYFVFAQVVVAVCLLICASMTLKSYGALRGRNSGVVAENVALVDIRVPLFRYHDASAAFRRMALESVRAAEDVVGIGSAAVAARAPLDSGVLLRAEVGSESGLRWSVFIERASARLFSVLGMRIAHGREFIEADEGGSEPVVIVNERLAQLLGMDGAAVGQTIEVVPDSVRRRRIVGVVADAREELDFEPPSPRAYLPYGQAPLGWFTLCIRSRGTDLGQVQAARLRVQALDPWCAVGSPRSMKEVVERRYARAHASVALLSLLSGIGALMTAIGIYGLVAKSVWVGRRDIAIRIAIGLTPSRAFLGQIQEMITSLTPGLFIGSVAGVGIGRLMTSAMYGEETVSVSAMLLGFTVAAVAGVCASAAGAAPLLARSTSDLLRRV